MAGQKRRSLVFAPAIPAIHVSGGNARKAWMPGTGPGMTGVRDLPKPLQHANFRPRRADAAGAVARVIPNKPVPDFDPGWMRVFGLDHARQ